MIKIQTLTTDVLILVVQLIMGIHVQMNLLLAHLFVETDLKQITKYVMMAILLIMTVVMETVFLSKQMEIVILTLNLTNVQFVDKDFEKILKLVTMEYKETIKDVPLIVNLCSLVGPAQEGHQQVTMFAKNVETEFSKELKFAMTTILLMEMGVILDVMKKSVLIVLELPVLVYPYVEMA